MEEAGCPSFDVAVLQLKDLLSRHGIDGEILWIFKEDVSVTRGGQPWIRWPVPSTNPREMEVVYENGRRSGNGVELSVYCALNGSPCCFVFVPQDKLDAEHRMIHGLKLSLPVSLRKARRLGKGVCGRLAHALAGGPWPDWCLDDAPSRSAAV